MLAQAIYTESQGGSIQIIVYEKGMAWSWTVYNPHKHMWHSWAGSALTHESRIVKYIEGQGGYGKSVLVESRQLSGHTSPESPSKANSHPKMLAQVTSLTWTVLEFASLISCFFMAQYCYPSIDTILDLNFFYQPLQRPSSPEKGWGNILQMHWYWHNISVPAFLAPIHCILLIGQALYSLRP